MPVIYSYPKGTSIIDSDSVLGTDQSNKNNTVTYTMVDIKDYVLKDLLDGVQFRLPIYGKPKVLTNSLFYQNTAAETGTAILGDTVYLNNGNNIGNLIVAQNITSSNGNIVSTVGNIAAGGSIAAGQTFADPSYRLKVNGASNFTGAIIADSTITVDGVATFNAAVKANSTVDIVSTLTVDGTSNLDGIVRLGGAVPSSSTGIFLNRLTYLNSDTTLAPAATLALQGPIKDSSGTLGSNEQVLVSDANGKMSWQFYQSSGLEFQNPWDASEGLPPVPTSEVTLANVGKYWVVSVAGNTNLDGITDWEIGDWAIISKDSADNVFWAKIDNSAAITGTGTNNTLTKWTGPTTLGDSIVSESGTTLTIVGDINSQGAIEGESLTINTGPSTLTGNVTFESLVTFEDDVSISGTVDMNSGTIENLSDPTAAQEAATKAYVDANSGGGGGVSGSGTNLNASMWLGSSPTTNLTDSPISFNLINTGGSQIYGLQFGFGSAATGDRNPVAIGYSNTAGGSAALATGHQTTANGLHAASFNFETTASGEKSAAFGDNTIASGKSSFAIGNNTTAATSLSFAGGKNSTANPDTNFQTAFAYGDNVSSTGNNSAAFGKNTQASGERSFVAGNNNDAQGNNSTAFGANNIAVGDNTIAIGQGNTAQSFNSIAIGTNNDTASYPNVTAIGINLTGYQDSQVILGRYNSSTSDKFVVGNGTAALPKNGLQISGASIKIPDYGSGSVTGTATYNLAVDSTGKIIETTVSGSANYSVQVLTADATGQKNYLYVLAGGSPVELTLPASPSSGDSIKVSNQTTITTCTINPGSERIMSIPQIMTLDNNKAAFELIYVGPAYGWVIVGATGEI